MSESLKKLKEIPVVNKIVQELDRALEIKDKVLAEFILDLAKKSQSVKEFEKILIDNEAEFSIELINNIYATVTRMLPEHFKKGAELVALEDQDGKDGGHFVKRKMLADEPEIPLHSGKDFGTEEEKFDKAENFDKNFLTKKYPSLAMPNLKNKEEIDILDDLDLD
jgi:hypothetical protein